jgi:hypothetical protein
MRYIDNGSGFSVQVSRREVKAFAKRWPCSGLPDRSVTFCFDGAGDLVDILPDRPKRLFGDSAASAASALCDDAKAFGESQHLAITVARARLARVCEGYTIAPDGYVKGPGKFEGETAATLFYYDVLMDGCPDSESADGTARFKVSPEERALFVERFGESMRLGRWFRIRVDDNGFVYGW